MDTDAEDNRLRFGAGLSTGANTKKALAEAVEAAAGSLNGAPVDLAIVFVSPHHADALEAAAPATIERLKPGVLLGCTGEMIAGDAREIEEGPAIAVWAAHLPGAKLEPFHVEYRDTPEGESYLGWPDAFLEPWPAGAALLVLADPFSFPADKMLARLNDEHPGAVALGGMASGGRRPDQNRLLFGSRVASRGAVGVRLHGGVAVRSVVSQGCRPIGKPFVITRADRNVIEELGGKPALSQLQDVFDALSPSDKRLVQQGLHVGRVVNEYQDRFARGDFLIRNVLGVEPDAGSVVIGDFVRPGQTIQFQVRDSSSADEDLRELLVGNRPPTGVGALLFTCNGRGTSLFPEPNHDAALIQREWGPLPVAGFFAQGEIGPIGGKNFLHGFTASIAVFQSAS
jgi:small ligand-binding sensory domain FIST